jgi:hypothetical protein
MSEVNVCKYNQSGFCKYRDKCKRIHNLENCKNKSDCTSQNCPNRHPKQCKNISRNGKCKYEEKCAYDHDKSSKEREQATLTEAVANLLKRHNNEILEMRQEMTQIKSKMEKHEEELSLFKRSETNPHVNTRSVVKQTNKKNIESTTEVLVSKIVTHDELQNTILSKGNMIQNEEINLKCQF